MDSRMIDVAIGLVLVFALASLLATTVVEGVATFFKQRGAILERALVSFAGDDVSTAHALLRHPLIVSLTQQTSDQLPRPSYLGGDVVIAALLGHITDQHAAGIRPDTPGELVSLVKQAPAAATAGLNPQLTQNLATLVRGVEADWQGFEKRLQAWYDAVSERATGWYKRWAQGWLFGVGFVMAAVLNINPLVIAPRLWNDAALRAALVQAGTQASEAFTAGSGTQAAAVMITPATLQQSRNVDSALSSLSAELKAVRERLELDPFDQIVRATVDARALAQALPAELAKIRAPQLADSDWNSVTAAVNARLDDNLARLASSLGVAAELAEASSLLKAVTTGIAQERDALRKRHSRQLPECTTASTESARQLCVSLNDLNALQGLGLPIGWSSAGLPDVVGKNCAAAEATGKPCESSWEAAAGNALLAILGWLVTAVAVTLGAPFWFDLLSKLVKLRGAGARTTADGKPRADDAPSVLSPTTTTTAPAVASFRDPMSDSLNDAERSLAPFEVQRLQRGLHLRDEQISGFFDTATRGAIKHWQLAQSDPSTGELTANQIRQLLGLGRQEVSDGHIG
jgi:hypothetical protein